MEEVEQIMAGDEERQIEACPCLLRWHWFRWLLKTRICKFLTLYFGMIFVCFIIFCLLYVNAYITCPAYNDGDYEQCQYPIYFAYFLIFQMIINVFMFHYTFKFNRVDSLVPMSVLLRKGAEYRNSPQFMDDMIKNNNNEFSNQSSEDTYKPKYCYTCQILVPERCHHCPLCQCCVLKKDHHCFVTGGCVGYANQRHFVVFLFYGLIGGMYASSYMVRYLNKFYVPFFPFGFINYILPIPFVQWFMGTCTFKQLCYVLLCNAGFWTTSGAVTFFGMQWYLILKNITMFERMKKQYSRHDSPSLCERIKLIFGPMWILNFIFPMPFKNKMDKSIKQFLHEFDTDQI